MEEKKLTTLTRELKLKEFQFNSIFEFSESIYTSLDIDNIIRVFFSTVMGHLGLSRAFIYVSPYNLFRRRGFLLDENQKEHYGLLLGKLGHDWFQIQVDTLDHQHAELKEFLTGQKIFHLVNISEGEDKTVVVGLGARIGNKEITGENIEYAYFVARFAVSAVENAFLINQLIDTKRLEHEVKIARDIQLSLLPQSLPKLENFEISVIYRPIHEVGGDYYDILKERKDGGLPILVSDVEGKGLSAALLAASSQAIFHSLNELYFFEPCKFIAKANEMIYNFTKGNRFITLFWMQVNDAERKLTYVNAGHESPFMISGDELYWLEKGGFLTGFLEKVSYEKETLQLKSGDIITIFTDGVPEVENPEGEQFGKDAMIDYLRRHRHLSAEDLTQGLYNRIMDYSRQKSPRDDFTLLILKAK